MLKKLLLALLLIALAISITGCQTVSGVGGDLQWTSEQTAALLEGQ